MTKISAVFFTVLALLILSGDIQANSLAVGIILMTVAIIQWSNYLSEKRVQNYWSKKDQQLFDQNATAAYSPEKDW